ncbi:hypothetical protein [Ammoniphilus sp. YIM 78166]|uniref:hypothetical protein n=1 Tax=Ammoniphilus sp. YIM 78166 TaxID=1644106 RepID=UPI00106F0EB4|nr:hypothetical protein [Ammoniphilus sp. YIM 78166]
MVFRKKIVGSDAEVFKQWLEQDENTVIDLDGKLYLVRPLKNDVQEEIESDPELKKIIQHAKKDIENGDLYLTDDILDAIERGEI